MKRRSFVTGLGSLWLPSLARAAQPLADDPFGLGVASGRPTAGSVVLWTRLMAQDPGGRLGGAIEVGWSLAEDDRMQKLVRSGTATAEPQWAHSVHVDVEGLKPNRPYWYRFTVNGKASAIGRTRTAPAADEAVPALRFAYCSCQQYEQGYYAPQRHLAAEDLNAVMFLGDYIYELSWGRDLVRHHGSGRTTTLEEYRNRYALYKSDRDLQAAHAAHPWIMMWDDHEVTDDYTSDIGPDDRDPGFFLKQRAAAYQAYWEHMPLLNAMRPAGPNMRLYDRLRFGRLAEIFTIDDRQYRSHHACNSDSLKGKPLENCAERLDPTRTMLGLEQEAWFAAAMEGASARWNVIGQQTLMAELDRGRGERQIYWADGWDGYPMARQRLLDAVAASPVKDTLVLGGDVHSFWAADLRRDFARPELPAIATEFVGGSLTSQNPPASRLPEMLRKNPHIRYANSSTNGYGLVELGPKAASLSFRVVDSVKKPDARISTLVRFAVEAGRPGVQAA
ncbi:MAG TPA: alkaline phosphatase D family protein [Reyranella sp.]|jgi:alkaline phosphatase D|nr:alkaline phosphatase D family protein [Reyranella sp.]